MIFFHRCSLYSGVGSTVRWHNQSSWLFKGQLFPVNNTRIPDLLSPFRIPQSAIRNSLLCLIVLCLAGCERGAVPPDRINLEPHASGDNQCGMYGEPLERPLRVLVEGPHKRGLLGGKGGRRPVSGTQVIFVVEQPEAGAVFDESGSAELRAETDVSGIASAWLRLGDCPGDVTVLASVETRDGAKSVRFRATAGVSVSQKDLEGPTGGVLQDVGLVLYDAPGKPAEGVTVCFRVEGNRHKSSVKHERLVTDHEGRAVTSWTLGQETQQYFLRAEIQDDRAQVPQERRFRSLGIRFEAMALNKSGMFINLLGGIAIFIFGMKLMSGGLQRMADRRLKAILQAVTRNRWLAVGVGALLTAVIQASSATTVMVVGFVNAGLLDLVQGIGVVFGANIGTTITAQIIAFKLNALAYPAIALGLIVASVAEKPSRKAFGESILGFGLLFLGMTTMSGVLKPLRYSPEFVSWFRLFECDPVGGVVPWRAALMCIVIGTVMTVLVQSSSATVGLVMALSGQGLVSFYTALPLVLGDNIGTTITALVVSIGANRNAKRAAVAHTMFNLIGAAYMYLLLFMPLWNGQPVFLGLVDWFTPGEAFAALPENLPRHVANAHSTFNIMNCLIFLPFIGVMARVCEKIVPVKSTEEESVLEYLEPRLLATPALALDQAVKEVAYMLEHARESFENGCANFRARTEERERRIRKLEKKIDRLQKEITRYIVGLSRQELSKKEASLIPALVHAVNDTERIGDHAEELIELAQLMEESNLKLSQDAMEDVRELEGLLAKQFDACHRALAERDTEVRREVKQRSKQLAALVARISEKHVKRLDSGECEILAGVIFLDYVAHLERIGDHLLNIAQRAKKVARVTE